ncbi:rod shape-determining protein RodA [bacterium]|nr:rod shape-determining protein RodA [bacterium]
MSDGSARSFDRQLLAGLALLLIVGLVALSSATYLLKSGDGLSVINRQLLWIGVGVAGAIFFSLTPLNIIRRLTLPGYLLSLFLLVFVLIAGHGPAGRWLVFAGISFQPAEAAKIASLLMLTSWLASREHRIGNGGTLTGAALIILLPFLLISMQPDLGTALVFIVLGLGMFFWIGVPGHWFLFGLIPIIGGALGFYQVLFFLLLLIILVTALWKRKYRRKLILIFCVFAASGWIVPHLWDSMPQYQKARITSFVGLNADVRGAAYQVIQSKIAIGSGGLAGKGFGKGTQTQLRFLPEHHTDFILSAFAEEFGFIGIILVIGLWMFVLWRCIRQAEHQDLLWNRFLIMGVSIIWGFQWMVNLCMVVGWAPVTGLPMPFFSYGGSAMVVNLCMAGLAVRRYDR